MLMSEAFPSAFLKAEDLIKADRPSVTVQVASCDYETVGENKLPVVRFIGKSAGLVLNKTNSNTLTDAMGDDTTKWHGRTIEIFHTKTDLKGALVDCLRVRIPQGPDQERVVIHPKEVINVDDDSDVPF